MDRYRMIGAGDGFLTVRAVKRAIDGSLGSRGAWLLAPYTDKPDSSGLNTDDPADIRKTAELAIQHGYQLCVHAIGDRANRETLNIFEAAFKAHPDKQDLRWRIEHAQHLSAADIPRFGRLGVIAAMQGVHCTSDAPYVLLRRMSREEALRSYTANNAFAAFEEKVKGSLEPGKLADITVLSRDIMTIPEDEILSTDVVYTIIGGKVAFDRTAAPR
jgi:predicted amidohydrolase YtcJ